MLQARLVSILEALGQGMDQQLPHTYLSAPADPLQPCYSPSLQVPSLLTPSTLSMAQLHPALATNLQLQPGSSALMSHMAERFSAVGLESKNSSVYNMTCPGLPNLPEMYQAPAGHQMGPPALPPEHIAAWHAAWLQQPLSAAAHTFQE